MKIRQKNKNYKKFYLFFRSTDKEKDAFLFGSNNFRKFMRKPKRRKTRRGRKNEYIYPRSFFIIEKAHKKARKGKI